MFCCLADELWAVVVVEAAENQNAIGGHHVAEVAHVSQENVSIDIGNNHIENAADMREHTRVALQHFHVFNLIQCCVVKTVLNAPFVDVIAYNLFRSTFRGDDAENARATTAVEHTFTFQVQFK